MMARLNPTYLGAIIASAGIHALAFAVFPERNAPPSGDEGDSVVSLQAVVAGLESEIEAFEAQLETLTEDPVRLNPPLPLAVASEATLRNSSLMLPVEQLQRPDMPVNQPPQLRQSGDTAVTDQLPRIESFDESFEVQTEIPNSNPAQPLPADPPPTPALDGTLSAIIPLPQFSQPQKPRPLQFEDRIIRLDSPSGTLEAQSVPDTLNPVSNPAQPLPADPPPTPALDGTLSAIIPLPQFSQPQKPRPLQFEDTIIRPDSPSESSESQPEIGTADLVQPLSTDPDPVSTIEDIASLLSIEHLQSPELPEIQPPQRPRPRRPDPIPGEDGAEPQAEPEPNPQLNPPRPPPGSNSEETVEDQRETGSQSGGQDAGDESATAVLHDKWGADIRHSIAREQRRARQRPVSGRVEVSITLSSTGNLLNAEVRHSSGNRRLDQYAVRMVEGAAFPPAPEDYPEESEAFLLPLIFE